MSICIWDIEGRKGRILWTGIWKPKLALMAEFEGEENACIALHELFFFSFKNYTENRSPLLSSI